MRSAWRLSISLVALVLVSCAAPGGIYKGYAGPDRDIRDLAVLDWTGPFLSKPRSAEVTEIDNDPVQKEKPQVAGVRNTIAHLLPGQHTLKIMHYWEDLYYDDPNRQFVFLSAKFLSGASYLIVEAPLQGL